MVRLSSFLAILPAVSAFTPSSNYARVHTQRVNPLKESFGFDFAEDQQENTPAIIFGEANYKQFINEVSDNAFLNRQYNVVRRVRELDLLGLTADLELLSKLEKNGLTLEKLEELLPAIEELGVLSLVANNQQLLINGVAPLLIEPAPILLPVVASLLNAGPSGFYALAAALAGTEFYLISNNVEVPFIGLSAGLVAGLLLVPLTVVAGGAGAFFSSLKK